MNKQANIQSADLLRASASLIDYLAMTLLDYTNMQVRQANTGKECQSDLEAAQWMRAGLADMTVTIEAMLHHVAYDDPGAGILPETSESKPASTAGITADSLLSA